ncbi:hypothetical protein D3877_16330 [Azospirillum cavernae]|uniref:Uncharacterized protein n=1 Tax=Azospirillum cavernae TaxID=2320860 RepID=A0A418VX05_9PROT|nr:hypothetical protein D3877_16330 [Azospirillum cavernae]
MPMYKNTILRNKSRTITVLNRLARMLNDYLHHIASRLDKGLIDSQLWRHFFHKRPIIICSHI